MAINSSPGSLRNSLAEIVALILVIVLVFWFFVKPKMVELSAVRADVKSEQAIANRVEADSAQLTKLVSKLQQSKKDVDLLDEALPLESRITRLEVLLDSLVSASGTKLATLNVQVGDKVVSGDKGELADQFGVERKLQTYTGDLTVTGSIDEFKNLLQLIETNGRIIEITNLDLTGDSGVPSYRLKLKAYSYDQ